MTWTSGTGQALGLLSGHASDLEDLEDVPDVVVDDQGAAPKGLVIATTIDDDVEGVDAAVLLVDIDLYAISVCHHLLPLALTYPVAVDGLDEHVHGRDELGADFLDAALAEDLPVDAAAVLLDEVGPHRVLAKRRGYIVALESGAGGDSTLELDETRLGAVKDVVVGTLNVKGRGSLVEGGTAGATVNVDAVMDGLDVVDNDSAVCRIPLSTYQVSGNRESSAQAEDAEDSDNKQQNCRAFDGEGHVGSVVVGDDG